MVNYDSQASNQVCCERFLSAIRSPACLIYVIYFLSSWGDQMWNFAVGLYLVKIDGDQLRLAAIFGFASGGSILLLGGIIGNWVDTNSRLKVIRVTLIVQNAAVALSALGVTFYFVYAADIEGRYNGALSYLGQALIIGLAIVAQLAKVGYSVAIEKDWFVVIAGEDKSKLANLNAATRAINLACKVLAPPLAGQIMTYATPLSAAVAIAAFSVVVVFVEYAMIWQVYRKVPRLAIKSLNNYSDETKDPLAQPMHDGDSIDALKNGLLLNGNGLVVTKSDLEALKQEEAEKDVEKLGRGWRCWQTSRKSGAEKGNGEEENRKSCLRMAFDPFVVLARGWRVYVRQKVLLAGVALSLLYMTVLGFDSITTGYVVTSGVSASVTSICMGLGGLTGLLGTFVFTRVRKRVGLDRTGLIAFASDAACLVLCLFSLWVPGSHFEPYLASTRSTGFHINCSRSEEAMVNRTFIERGSLFWNDTLLDVAGSSEVLNSTLVGAGGCVNPGYSISIILFLVGIIASRVGEFGDKYGS